VGVASRNRRRANRFGADGALAVGRWTQATPRQAGAGQASRLSFPLPVLPAGRGRIAVRSDKVDCQVTR